MKNASKISSLSAAEKLEQETVHEKKHKRLKHIAEVMLDLKNHLQNEQVEYIEVIQKKVVYLLKILDVINTFYTKGAISKSMIGNIVRMNHNNTNNVKHIILSNSNKSSNDFLKTLSEKMKKFVSSFKKGMRINKRSIIQKEKSTVQQLKSLSVDKLNLKNEQNSYMNPNLLSIAHSEVTFHFNKNINVRRLVVGTLTADTSFEGNRHKRTTTLGSINHSKIKSDSINHISLENFLNSLFKNEKKTFINGSFKLQLL